MGKTTLTVTEELADELEQYGETRTEQLASVLDLARSVEGTNDANADVMNEIKQLRAAVESQQANSDSGNDGLSETEAHDEIVNRLDELGTKMDRLPDRLASELR